DRAGDASRDREIAALAAARRSLYPAHLPRSLHATLESAGPGAPRSAGEPAAALARHPALAEIRPVGPARLTMSVRSATFWAATSQYVGFALQFASSVIIARY